MAREKREDHELLADLMTAVERMLEKIGVRSYQEFVVAFNSDEDLRDVLMAQAIKIGECVGDLMKKSAAGLSTAIERSGECNMFWKQFVRLRNDVAHEYYYNSPDTYYDYVRDGSLSTLRNLVIKLIGS